MQKWMLKSVLTVACLGIFSATAHSQTPFHKVGDWWKEVKSQFRLDSQRNNALPQPFASQDQIMVQQTFASMYMKGAVLSRVLDSVHFDPKTHKLNNAGRTRLREILDQNKPLDILVASTLDPTVDKQRQENLKGLLSSYTFNGHRPGVATTFHLPHHNIGSERQELRQKYFNALPQPTLESVSGDVSGSTGQ